MLAPAAAPQERQRPPLRHEQLAHRNILAARSRHAHGVPGVDDLVIGLGHEAQPPINGRAAVLLIDAHRQHVPFRIVDRRGERPAAVDDEAARRLASATGRKRD